MSLLRLLGLALPLLTLAACGSVPKATPTPAPTAKAPAQSTAPSPSRGGGYYLDDGPGNAPANIDEIPDAEPRSDPLHKFANRPYTVLGKTYVPSTTLAPYKARGIASWYGRKFHGQKTSTGEAYDMYGMTAAHPTLPIPSYVRVTSLVNNKSVIVRVNDRGPFLSERLIDLSYTAAHKLGIAQRGSGMVEVESIDPNNFSTPSVVASAPVAKQAPIIAPEKPAVISEKPLDPPLVPMAAGTGGVYLQLGAFGNKTNAENFLNQIRAKLDWVKETMQIFSKDGLFRVNLGPYPSAVEARLIGDKIRQNLEIIPVVTGH